MRYDRTDETEAMIQRANAAKSAPLPGLFEIQHPAPSQPAPASEHAADALTFTEKGRNRRAKQLLTILALIGSRDCGYTGDEIDAVTNAGSGSITARVDDLRTMQYIVTRHDISRKTRRGKPAAVQMITDKGRDRLKEEAQKAAA